VLRRVQDIGRGNQVRLLGMEDVAVPPQLGLKLRRIARVLRRDMWGVAVGFRA